MRPSRPLRRAAGGPLLPTIIGPAADLLVPTRAHATEPSTSRAKCSRVNRRPRLDEMTGGPPRASEGDPEERSLGTGARDMERRPWRARQSAPKQLDLRFIRFPS